MTRLTREAGQAGKIRDARHAVAEDEIGSSIRALDFARPERQFREVSPGHLVQVWSAIWDK